MAKGTSFQASHYNPLGTEIETGELADGAVTNVKVNASAAITESKISFATSGGHTHDGSNSTIIVPGTVEARTFNTPGASVDTTVLTVTVTGGTFTNFIGLDGTIEKTMDASGNGELEVDANPNAAGAVVIWGAAPRTFNNSTAAYFQWSSRLDTDDTTKMDFANDTVFRIRINGSGDDINTEVWGK